MKIKEKVYDGHIHTTMRVPVRESVEIFKQEFADLGVTKGVFASTPLSSKNTRYMDKTQNVKTLYYKAVFTPNAYAFCGLEHDFDMPQEQKAEYFLSQAKEYLANGYDGFKILEGMPSCIKKTGLLLNDAVFEPFWAYLEQVGCPILIHNAHPKYFWDEKRVGEYWKKRGCYYGEGMGYPAFEEIVGAIFEVLDRHPNLKITLAHMGFLSEDYDLAEKFMSYKNTMLDVTPGGEQFINFLNGNERKIWTDFIVKYSDRIKYGTDLYNFERTNDKDWKIAFHRRPDFIRQVFESDKQHDYCGDKFVGMKLPKKLRNKIYRENLINELGEPKTINFDWAINKVKELRQEFSDIETLDGYDLMCIENDFESLKNKNI